MPVKRGKWGGDQGSWRELGEEFTKYQDGVPPEVAIVNLEKAMKSKTATPWFREAALRRIETHRRTIETRK